jgi:hypothetical protein
MGELNLADLYNPNNISAVLINNTGVVEAGKNQGFQEYPKSVELWEKMEDGRLLRVKRWLSKSIICKYHS